MIGIETLLGGITGLVGSVVTAVVNFKTQKLKNDHDRAMAEIDIKKMDKEKEIMLAEAEANMRITEVETEAKIELADAEVYKQSIIAAQKDALSEKIHEKLLEGGLWGKIGGTIIAFFFGLVDILKKFIRPGLTLYLVGLTTWITIISYDVIQKHNDGLSAVQAKEIFDSVTTIVIYLTVTCVTWWFGDRRMAKFLMRLDDGNLKTPPPIGGRTVADNLSSAQGVRG